MDLDISTQAKLPTKFGDFVIQSFLQNQKEQNAQKQNAQKNSDFAHLPKEHLVVLSENLAKILAQNKNENTQDTNAKYSDFSAFVPLLRVHSECLTGDVFGSQKCDCGAELALAMQKIASSDKDGKGGLMIYLRQEGRGIGLFNKVNAYALQDKGYDTVEANIALGFRSDDREYGIVGRILEYYGIKEVELLTNNPKKIEAISRFVKVKRSEIIIQANKHNEQYLATKKAKLGHLL